MALTLDGFVVEAALNSRGRNLTDAQVRRWRDYLYTLLVCHANLSVPDAMEVMGRSLSEQHVRLRLRKTAPAVKKLGLVGMLVELTRQAHSGRPALRGDRV